MVHPGDNKESGFPTGFQKMVYDLMVQHPDDFKGFVGAIAPSTDLTKFNCFSRVIAEAADNKQLESTTMAEAFKEIHEEISKKEDDEDVKSINDADFSDNPGSDLSSDNGEEEEDNIAPLMSERASSATCRTISSPAPSEFPMDLRSNFSRGGASSRRTGVGGDGATLSRRNLLSHSGNLRRQESMRIRTTIRKENTQIRGILQQQSVRNVTESADDALAKEISYREKLEVEIDQLERMLDDQDDDIDELDKVVRKSKKKNKELMLEIKTKTRTILILEEKYSMLKSELCNANRRADNLHVILSEIQMEKELDLSAIESARYPMEIELAELRKLKSDNDSISKMHTTLAEKEKDIMDLMAEVELGKSLLHLAKKERKTLEKSVGSSAASILAEEGDGNDSSFSFIQNFSDSFADKLKWGKKKENDNATE